MAEAPAAPPASNPEDLLGKGQIVIPKKWQAVAMWSYDVVTDTCAICKGQLNDMCLDCQTNNTATSNQECQLAWGQCNHTFHHHCISKWLKTRQVCPLDNREWELNRVGDNTV